MMRKDSSAGHEQRVAAVSRRSVNLRLCERRRNNGIRSLCLCLCLWLAYNLAEIVREEREEREERKKRLAGWLAH